MGDIKNVKLNSHHVASIVFIIVNVVAVLCLFLDENLFKCKFLVRICVCFFKISEKGRIKFRKATKLKLLLRFSIFFRVRII